MTGSKLARRLHLVHQQQSALPPMFHDHNVCLRAYCRRLQDFQTASCMLTLGPQSITFSPQCRSRPISHLSMCRPGSSTVSCTEAAATSSMLSSYSNDKRLLTIVLTFACGQKVGKQAVSGVLRLAKYNIPVPESKLASQNEYGCKTPLKSPGSGRHAGKGNYAH